MEELFHTLNEFVQMLDAEWRRRTERATHLALENHRKSVLLRKTLAALSSRVGGLLTSEKLLAQCERLAHVGMWEMDKETRNVVCSKTLQRILGLRRGDGQANQKAFIERLHEEDREKTWHGADRALRGEECEQEMRYLHPDGTMLILQGRYAPVRDLEGRITGVAGITRDITGALRVEENLHRLSQQLINQRDEDRRRLAREMHDSAGQSVGALKIALSNLQEELREGGTQSGALLQSAMELADATERDVRTISYVSHPPMLDEAGLLPALKWLARGFGTRSGIEMEVEIADDFGRLPREAETSVFRIVQEALTNVHRYSGTPKVTIRLARESNRIRVEIQDYGRGFAIQSISRDRQPLFGVGIAGMRERMKELHGMLEVESSPGRGTIIRALFAVRLTDAVACSALEPEKHKFEKQIPPPHAQLAHAHAQANASRTTRKNTRETNAQTTQRKLRRKGRRK